VHGKRCALSVNKTCKCSCGGSLHGSAWWGASPSGPGTHAAPSRRRKTRRIATVAAAVAITVTGTVGGLAATGNLNASAGGSNNLSLKVSIDLNKAVASLASLGVVGRQTSSSGISGTSHLTGCAQSATGQVRQFLARYPCKQYAASIWTVTRQDATTQVVFSWVEMPTTPLADQYKTIVDTFHSGNPPGAPTSTFNGRCYASGQQDSIVWAVEVRPTKNRNNDRKILQAAAQRTLSPGYLNIHCTK
jgi:hypothetical protein